jgi:hypothetical protein
VPSGRRRRSGERRGNLRFGGAVGWCGGGHGTPFVAILRKGLKAANVIGGTVPAPNGCSRITFILAVLPHPPATPDRTPSVASSDCESKESAMQFRTILAASAAVIIGAVSAQAAEVAALSGDNTISIVNTSSKSVTKTWKIQGVSGKVLGIDVRPATACSTRWAPTAASTRSISPAARQP